MLMKFCVSHMNQIFQWRRYTLNLIQEEKVAHPEIYLGARLVQKRVWTTCKFGQRAHRISNKGSRKKIGAKIHKTTINSIQPHVIQLYTRIGYITESREPGCNIIPRVNWHVTKLDRESTSRHNNRGVDILQ